MRGLLRLVVALAIGWVTLIASAAAFDCVETTCPEIKTCAEARYKLEVCGHTKRDADHDGIPCEDVCGKDKQTYEARANAGVGPSVAIGQGLTTVQPPLNLFSCAGKRTCKQMISCEEATYYLKTCGVASLDGDKDGKPCNSLCR